MSETVQEAIRSLNANDLPRAEELLTQAVAATPDDAKPVHLLGLVRYRQGRLAESIELIRRSIELLPDMADLHNNLGEALRAIGDDESAEAAYRRALELKPAYPEPLANLALLHMARRDLARAEQLLHDALRINPNFPDAHQHLGNLFRESGRLDEAVASFQTALRLRPHYPKAWHRLGLTLVALHRQSEAIPALQNAVKQEPNYADAWFDLGSALKDIGRLDLAAQCWQKTLSIHPDTPAACVNLAHIRTRQGLLSQAVDLLRRAIELNPDTPAAHNNLANALGDQGKLDEAVSAYREAIARHPADHIAHSNLLFLLNHHPAYPPARLFEEHTAWARQHAANFPHVPTSHTPQATGPLRIGYVSADFRDNQVGFFLEPLLTHHDHSKFTIKCYSDTEQHDAVTDRLKHCADEWDHTLPLSDAAFADRVRHDRIDILVDLTVHAGRHRLLAFARKPAPVQMTYLGYPNTTGLSAIDYRLTDPHLDPPGLTESVHAERLLRLPETYFCYRPSPAAPKVAPLPYLKSGHITFGSFNRLLKLTDRTIELWSQVLRAVPKSKLVLKSQGLADPPTRDHIAAQFQMHGVPPDRLEFHGWSDLASYLDLMSHVDLALDPTPFAGGTTTCHLLWQGVPTVTLTGPSPVSRIGLSLLANAGLPDLAASTPADYVRTAVALARDTPRLARLRNTMRDRLRQSPLLAAPRFARYVEQAYLAAWQRHALGLPADHITLSSV